jgi:hypothetical protein
MRRLTGREFLHFNPLRFNIYYLAGMIAAGITTLLALVSGPDQNENVPPRKTFIEVPVSEAGRDIVKPPDKTPGDKKVVEKVNISDSVRSNGAASVEADSIEAEIPEKDAGTEQVLSPGKATEHIKSKELFTRSSEDNFRLQGIRVPGDQYLEPSVTEGCAPLKVLFRITYPDSDSCLWTFGDGGSSRGRDPEWIYDIEGEYRVILKIFGPEGVISSASEVISVYPKPSARFELSPDKAVIPEDEIRFQNYSAAAVRYLWSFGDGNTSEQFEPVHSYQKYGNYDVSLTVFSEKGCSDSLAVLNAFFGSAYYIEFPNAFIPNTGGPSGGVYSSRIDESAQVFHPSSSGVSDYHLKIFSKPGVLIFETNDINVGWDGYYKGQLSNSGVYIWKVRGNFSNGEPFTKMGDVTLLKN